MDAICAVSLAVALFVWCGAGPALLLLRKRGAHRLAAVPAIGLCAGVVFTIFLSRFALPGRTIALIALIFFGIVNAAAWRHRPARPEWRSSLPVLGCGAAAVLFSAWPMIWSGYTQYWGFANPDHAFYLPVIEYLDSHPFDVPPDEYLGVFRPLGSQQSISIGYDTSVILGISYFLSMFSLLTGVAVTELFGVFTAATVFIVPASVYFLCDYGLRLPRRVSLAAASLTACSSLITYTLCLHSLGTMTVIAILPVGIALALGFYREPRAHQLVAAVLVCAGMYYEYFPGFAILALTVGVAAIAAFLRRRVRARPLLALAGATLLALFAISSGHGVTVLRRLIFESLSSRLAEKDNELLASFALVLTEKGLPFFWGLRLPYPEETSMAGDYGSAAICILLFVALGAAAWRRVSGLSSEFLCALGAVLALLTWYAISGNGYGAFKVVAWIHPLVLTALAASVLGAHAWLQERKHRAGAVLALTPLIGYATLNTAHAIALGRESLRVENGRLSNAPRLRIGDFRGLQEVASRWGQSGLIAAIPDSVAQYWLLPFLRPSKTVLFPSVKLSIEDSFPRLGREALDASYVLNWTDDSQEIAGVRSPRAIWRNDKFSLTPLDQCRDLMTFGLGWYRKEGKAESAMEWGRHFRWLRKRGELLILNPAPHPKRVLLTMVAGYGHASPTRHVELYLNGRKFDEIEFSGQARTLTRSFVATGAWSQLELVIRESALPLPRENALWNRWVPSDARRLNLAVSEAQLIDATEAGAMLTSALDFGLGAPARGLAQGVYADGWAGTDASMVLRAPDACRELEIKGMAPAAPALSYPYKVALSVNGAPVDTPVIQQPGWFRLRIPLANLQLSPGAEVRLHLGPLPVFRGPGDPRSLSLQLSRVAFVQIQEAPVAAVSAAPKN